MTSEITGPSAVEAYGFGWSELKRCWLDLLLIGVVWLLVSAPSGYLREGVLGLAYNALVLGPVGFGGMYAYLRAARGETPEVSDLFVPFQRNYAQAVLASILIGVLVAIGTVLLVVPGIIAAVRLSWVPFLVVDEGLDAIAAVRESWERTRDHGWTIFGIWLIAVPILIAGCLLLIVGVIPAAIWIHLASASLFAAVTARDKAAREAGLAPAG